MIRAAQRKLLLDLLALPTSPLCEQRVAAYVREWAALRPAIAVTTDRFGNLRLRLRRGKPQAPPLALTAHMDHPGFEALRMTGPKRLLAAWRGGVPTTYFRGSRVRFHHQEQQTTGVVTYVKLTADRKRVDRATMAVDGPVPAGAVGVWDLPRPTIRGKRVHAGPCDDLAGVAAILAAMDELCRSRSAVDVIALLTRCEEVGFAGALAACRSGILPKRSLVVAVETSSEIAGVKMGDGPILRVGDRASVFDPAATQLCGQVAAGLAKRDRRFRFQRKLMDGGTCESTAYVDRGYRATGLCIALGNYHNVDSKRRRIAPEYVDLVDWQNLVKWFVALATKRQAIDKKTNTLTRSLDRLDKRWSKQLERTASRTR